MRNGSNFVIVLETVGTSCSIQGQPLPPCCLCIIWAMGAANPAALVALAPFARSYANHFPCAKQFNTPTV